MSCVSSGVLPVELGNNCIEWISNEENMTVGVFLRTVDFDDDCVSSVWRLIFASKSAAVEGRIHRNCSCIKACSPLDKVPSPSVPWQRGQHNLFKLSFFSKRDICASCIFQ